jgi:hypothetical protein
MDCGHTDARNSQAAVLFCASGNKPIFSLTDTTNNAYYKESILVAEALDFAINVKKLDVVAVDIDENVKNANLISEYTRSNGPEETKDEPVRAGNDIFHTAKALGKNSLKCVLGFANSAVKYFKPFCEKKYDMQNVIESLLPKLVSKSAEFFKDLHQTFENHGALSWKAASISPASMNAFAVENNLIDKILPRYHWEAVIVAWNSIFVKNNVTSVSSMKIREGFSKINLRLLAEAVFTATGNDIPITDKETEKELLFEYLKNELPDQCFRGENFSVDFDTTLQALEKSFAESPPLSDASHIDLDDTILSKIFGQKQSSLKEVRLLKTKE